LSAVNLTANGGVAVTSANGNNAGAINVTADTGHVSIAGTVAASGSDGSNNGGTARLGGGARPITISAGNGISLGGNVTAVGGAGGNGGAQGNGADIAFTGPVSLSANVAVNTSGATRGNIRFNNALDSLNATTTRTLTLTGQNVTFGGTAGGAFRLGVLSIDATGAVNAATNAITADALAVTQSTDFTSGAITTSSTTGSGGNVAIRSTGTATVGGIASSTTQTGLVGGAIAIDAAQIVLNGDIDAREIADGTSRTATLTLTSPGTITLNHPTDFTSPISLFGTSGADTLIAANRTNDWVITGNSQGTLNTDILNGKPGITFTAFETLKGNDGNDTFTFNAGSSLTNGVIDGGLGTNTLDMSALNAVNVSLAPTTTTGALLVSKMGSIKGNNANSTLTGDDIPNTWTVSTANGGTINGTVVFSGFTALVGGAVNDQFDVGTTGFKGTIGGGDGNDTFNVSGSVTGDLNGNGGDDLFSIKPGGSVTGFVDGGAQTTGDRLDLGSGAIVHIGTGLGQAGVRIRDIEGVNSVNGSLYARDNYNTTWNISTGDGGDIQERDSGGAVTTNLTFTGFSDLYGSSGNDTFNMTGNGSLSGQIKAGNGNNSLAVTLNNTRLGGQVYYTGGTGTDTVTVNGTSTDVVYTPALNLLNNTFDRLAYTGTNAFFVNYTPVTVSSVTDNVTAGSLTINGTTGNDAINLSSTTFGVDGAPTVNFLGKTNIIVDGGLASGNVVGADTINLTDGINLSGALTLKNTTTLTQQANTALTVNALVLDNVNTTPAGPKATPLTLKTSVASFGASNSGPITLDETNDLQLSDFDTTGAITITAGGAISGTPSAQRMISGPLTLHTTAGIALDTPFQNSFSGPIDVQGSVISLDNRVATNLTSVAASVALTVHSGGDITQSGTGTITVPGSTSLTAPGHNITLTNSANNFSQLYVGAASVVTISDADRIESGLIAADNVTLNTVTGIGNPGTGAFSTVTGKLTVNNAGSGGVYIANFASSTIGITTTGDIELANIGDLVIDKLYTSGQNVTDVTGFHNVNLTVDRGSVSAYTGSPAYPGLVAHSETAAPDITAKVLNVVSPSGNFGTTARPMSLAVADEFAYYFVHGYVYYFGAKPYVHGNGDLLSFSPFDTLTSQQLIQIESLGEFDPAIFTAVRNYYYEDVAIKMPADQRLDGSDEDDGEGEKKKL
jgi:hypothetical protein